MTSALDYLICINPLIANATNWPNTNCLSVFDHFMVLALKGLNKSA